MINPEAKADQAANVRLEAFLFWLEHPELGQELIYHKGELARDAEQDPQLAELSERLRELSNGEYDIVSKCGHVRGHVSGTRVIELVTSRIRGGIVYIARRL